MDSPLHGNQSAAEDERRRAEQRPTVGLTGKNRKRKRGREGSWDGVKGKLFTTEKYNVLQSTVCMYKY